MDIGPFAVTDHQIVAIPIITELSKNSQGLRNQNRTYTTHPNTLHLGVLLNAICDAHTMVITWDPDHGCIGRAAPILPPSGLSGRSR
jgi:hypothetical protein